MGENVLCNSPSSSSTCCSGWTAGNFFGARRHNAREQSACWRDHRHSQLGSWRMWHSWCGGEFPTSTVLLCREQATADSHVVGQHGSYRSLQICVFVLFMLASYRALLCLSRTEIHCGCVLFRETQHEIRWLNVTYRGWKSNQSAVFKCETLAHMLGLK